MELSAGRIQCTRRTVYIGISMIIWWTPIGNQGHQNSGMQSQMTISAVLSVSALVLYVNLYYTHVDVCYTQRRRSNPEQFLSNSPREYIQDAPRYVFVELQSLNPPGFASKKWLKPNSPINFPEFFFFWFYCTLLHCKISHFSYHFSGGVMSKFQSASRKCK